MTPDLFAEQRLGVTQVKIDRYPGLALADRIGEGAGKESFLPYVPVRQRLGWFAAKAVPNIAPNFFLPQVASSGKAAFGRAGWVRARDRS